MSQALFSMNPKWNSDGGLEERCRKLFLSTIKPEQIALVYVLIEFPASLLIFLSAD